MKYAFEIESLVLVEADSEQEAWEKVRAVTSESVQDFDFKRADEFDEDDDD